MTKRKTIEKPVYEFLLIKLISHSASTSAGINYLASELNTAQPDTHVYSARSDIELRGLCFCSEEREGHEFRFTIYGGEPQDKWRDTSLHDFHLKDKTGQFQYRKRGDKRFPVYDPPTSIGYLEKIRGEKAWCVSVWLPSSIVSDMLTLLSSSEQLYVHLHEIKIGNRHGVRGITLQKKDPAEE